MQGVPGQVEVRPPNFPQLIQILRVLYTSSIKARQPFDYIGEGPIVTEVDLFTVERV